jgi:hypothetical protein
MGGLAQQIEQELTLTKSYASKSLERRVPNNDAIEMLKEFKRKHMRGLSHNRFD